jgi:hypothetical protein
MKRLWMLSLVLVIGVGLIAPGATFAKPKDPEALCHSKKLNASSIFVKKLFYASAHLLKNPAFDEATFVGEAETQFSDRWGAVDPGGDCDFPWNTDIDIVDVNGDPQTVNFATLDDLIAWIEAEVDAIAAEIEGNVDDQDQASVNLGDKLLKAAGKKAFSLLKSESKDIKKPNSNKKDKKQTKAHKKFGKKWEKATKKAEKKGVEVTVFTEDVDPADGEADLFADVEAMIDTLVANIVTIFTTTVTPPP